MLRSSRILTSPAITSGSTYVSRCEITPSDSIALWIGGMGQHHTLKWQREILSRSCVTSWGSITFWNDGIRQYCALSEITSWKTNTVKRNPGTVSHCEMTPRCCEFSRSNCHQQLPQWNWYLQCLMWQKAIKFQKGASLFLGEPNSQHNMPWMSDRG